MAKGTTVVLIKDAHLPWAGPFPYDHLAARLEEIGAHPIGPDSTSAQIKDSFFDLMAVGQPTHADRLAWDALRRIDQRLVSDFFMYEVPAPDLGSAVAELGQCQVPVVLPDFRQLAAVAPDFSRLRVPGRLDPDPHPGPTSVPVEDRSRCAIDIGVVPVDFLAVLESTDE